MCIMTPLSNCAHGAVYASCSLPEQLSLCCVGALAAQQCRLKVLQERCTLGLLPLETQAACMPVLLLHDIVQDCLAAL